MTLPSNLTIKTNLGTYTIMCKETRTKIYFDVYDNDNDEYLKEHHLKIDKDKLEDNYKHLTRAYKVYFDEVIEALMGVRKVIWDN